MISFSNTMKKISTVLLILLLFSLTSVSVFASSSTGSWPSKETLNTQTVAPIESTNQTNTTTNNQGTNTITPTDDSVKKLDEIKPVFNEDDTYIDGTNNYAGYQDILPRVTMNDILEWVSRKTYEVIRFFQIMAQPICIVIFIISAFMALLGTIGRGDLTGKGIWGMIMSAIVYALVLYAPIILNTFVGWVAT